MKTELDIDLLLKNMKEHLSKLKTDALETMALSNNGFDGFGDSVKFAAVLEVYNILLSSTKKRKK